MHETWIKNGNRDTVHETNAGFCLKRISWSAIFAGVIAALIVHILLALLGTAIGATSVDWYQDQKSFQHLGIGALVWTALNMLISTVVGSYIAGRLAPHEGALHGLLMFGVSTIIALWLAILLASNLIGSAFNVIGAGANAFGRSLSVIASPISNMVQEKLRNTNVDNLQNEFKNMLGSEKSELQSEKLYKLKHQAEQAARETAYQATSVTAKMSWYAFFMLVIESILAAMMGRIGRRNQLNQNECHDE
ncbi:hypothetical protein [Pantoea sp. Mhis]|uniref:hypothetical protein n=1 Tax=Pantoea sp. Mhis TaxID=2576759 RepID=UPI001359D460|nr:hypothetical protein [Pantoea sp. Mhis]MXP56602.1 hypothetical protein [Pantoea sp. Mhis]